MIPRQRRDGKSFCARWASSISFSEAAACLLVRGMPGNLGNIQV